MRQLFLSLVAASMAMSGVSAAEVDTTDTSMYPEFSWDTVPVTIHLSKKEGDFSQDQIDFMAKFPLVCIEKHQGLEKYGDVLEGTYVAADAIKSVNPSTKVILYWNTRIDFGVNYFGHNILDEGQHPEWSLKDLEGKDVLIRGRQKTYDPTNAEFRKWWISIPEEACRRTSSIDGLFLDAMPQYFRDRELIDKAWGKETVDGIRRDVCVMLSDLNDALGKDKIIVANSIHAIADFETGAHKYVHGSMIEHFCSNHLRYTLEDMAEQIEFVQDAGRRGRIMMVKCWPRYCFLNSPAYKSLPQEQIEAEVKEDIEFPLACFLIAAGKYSYFCYSWGYMENMGGLVDYPEYHYPLGEPEGEAVRDGWKYSRRFEHAYVTMDLENRTSNIEWF